MNLMRLSGVISFSNKTSATGCARYAEAACLTMELIDQKRSESHLE